MQLPVRALPSKQLRGGLNVVPATDTDFSTKETVITQITVCNTTATDATFIVKDKQTTPLTLVNTIIPGATPGGSTYVLEFPSGVRMLGGVSWSSGTASALNAEIFGYV